MSSGQPRVENGHSADENQVSSTSGSCSQPLHRGRLVGADADDLRRRARTRPGCGAPTTAGGRCTSRACRRPSRSSAAPSTGDEIETRPSRTASPAALASGSTLTNHCLDRRGSTTVSQREQCPTAWTYGRFSATMRPSDRRSATTAGRASNRSSPWNRPGAVMMPRSSMMSSAGRSCRWPISKSLGSCAGVTLTAPVPNAGSTCSSATIGMRRPVERQHHLGAHEVAVALVVRVHGHRGVAEHRLGPRRRHDDRARRRRRSGSR